MINSDFLVDYLQKCLEINKEDSEGQIVMDKDALDILHRLYKLNH